MDALVGEEGDLVINDMTWKLLGRKEENYFIEIFFFT